MARRSRATGVGRGNGPGSARSQFKDGMPSANPNGRPRKEKELPGQSVSDAVEKIMRRNVDLTVDGQTRKMPQFQAMLEFTVAEFPKMSTSSKLRLLQFCIETAPDILHSPSPQLGSDAVMKFVEELVKESNR